MSKIIKNNISYAGSELHTYSTAEQEVGTWIDGSKVYEKVWVFNSAVTLSNNSWTNAIEPADPAWLSPMQILSCIALSETLGTCFTCVSAQFDVSANRIKLLNTRGTNITIDKVIIQYCTL